MARSTKAQTMLHRAVSKRNDPRLKPPANLPAQQAAIWHQVVDNLPAEWFSAEQTGLLVGYCNHVARAAQIQEALATLDPVADLKTFDTLSKAAALESSKITMLARSMRLTQQSRLKAETAYTRSDGHAEALAGSGDENDELLA